MAAHQILPDDALAFQLEAPVGFAALGLELGLVLVRQVQGGAVVDRRLAARELNLATTIQLFLSFVAGIEAAGGLQGRGGAFIAIEAFGLIVPLAPG